MSLPAFTSRKNRRKRRPASLSAVGADAGARSATGYAGSTSEYPTTASEYRSQQSKRARIWPIVKESLQGAALSALLLGVALGIFTRPDSVYESFYNPLFRGLLSVLMLVMGMEAWSRLGELRKVAQWYVVYAVVAPLVHGLIAFGLGMIAHYVTGFSLGGVVILAVIACSSSDISGRQHYGQGFPPLTLPPILVLPPRSGLPLPLA